MGTEEMTTAEYSLGEDDSVVALDEQQVKKANKTEARNRWMLVFFSALYVTFIAGAFFGYGPLQLMLEAQGLFEDECQEGEETPCPEQTSRLLQSHFVAQLTLMFTPISGAIADRYSATTLMIFVAFFGVLGLILLIITSSLGTVDNLFYVGDFCLGLMTTSSTVMTVQTGLVFTKIVRQRVISALNTLFDAGALTYLALWGIEQALDCGVTAMIYGYLAVAAFCCGGAIYYWKRVVPVLEDDTVSEHSSQIVDQTNEMDQDESGNSQRHASEDADNDHESNSDDSKAVPETNNTAYVVIVNRDPPQQLKSKLFIVLCTFFAIHGTQNNFTITTARDFLAYLGDDETGNKYLTIFTLLTPVSILGLPFMDFVLNHYGYAAGFQCINILSLAHGIIMVSSDNLNVQVFGFLIFSFFRCFLFTVSFSFVTTFLGNRVVGRGSGYMTFWFGLLSFINVGLSSWAINGLDGNFFWPNFILTLAVFPCIVLAWIMGKCIDQEHRAKEQLKGEAA